MSILKHPTGGLGATVLVQFQGIRLPVQDTWVRPLGWEDPLEKETTPHTGILAWEIPRRGEPGGL